MKAILSALLFLIASFTASAGAGAEQRLTRAQFTSHADAICKQAAAEQVKLASRHKNGPIILEDAELVSVIFVPPMAKEARRLRALRPPQADQEKVQTFLEAVASGVEDARYDDLDLFFKRSDPFAKADSLARRYGLKACADSSHAAIRPRG